MSVTKLPPGVLARSCPNCGHVISQIEADRAVIDFPCPGCKKNSFSLFLPIMSNYPKDFIPAGAEPILGQDLSKDGDCTVKGFFDPTTGEYHIQEVIHTANGDNQK